MGGMGGMEGLQNMMAGMGGNLGGKQGGDSDDEDGAEANVEPHLPGDEKKAGIDDLDGEETADLKKE